MRRLDFLCTALGLGLLLGVPLGAGAQGTDPAALVRAAVERFVDARNRGDVAGMLALVTDDVRFIGGPVCPPAAPCLGTEALRTEVQSYIGAHVRVTLVGTPQVSGTTLRARVEASADPYRAAGLDRVINDVTVEVRDGKIASWIGSLDARDPQTARWLALQGPPPGPGVVPPLRLPNTGAGSQAAPARLWTAGGLAGSGALLCGLLLLGRARRPRTSRPRPPRA
jgi:SnoaL-like domain